MLYPSAGTVKTLLGIVEDYAYRLPLPASDTTDTVPQIHTICSFRAFDWAIMDGEDYCITLSQRHHLRTRLHSWPLLCQHELTAREILTRLGEQDDDLQREGKIAVQILMEAVEIAWNILKQERRRSRLAHRVTLYEELPMFHRVAEVETHSLIPAVCNGCEPGVQFGAQSPDRFRERVTEIFILPLPEPVLCHDDMTAEPCVVPIQRGEFLARFH
jgi:hypothetical protein